MKKGDYILIGTVIVLTVLLSVFIYTPEKDLKDAVAVITVDGNEYKRLSLNEDTVIEISSDGVYNRIVIEDGCVRMEDANCPDKLCLRHKKISKTNESIVCLPNRVMIRIIGKDEVDVDAVS